MTEPDPQSIGDLPTADLGPAGAPGSSAGRGRVGPYQLLAPLGAGGMGVVYRARGPSGRDVALKLVKLAGQARQERFRREAQLLARFNHPGILRVHDFGEVEGQAGIATELLEDAQPLDANFREQALAARVELIADVAATLGVVHAAGVVHRDVKPENLLLTRDGRVRLTDFGISLADDQDRLTKTGHLVGTLSYLSPEQARGERDVGPTADVWALGLILYQAMTGRSPFEAENMIELFGRVSSANFPPPRSLDPDLPRDLEAICLRALALAPSDRYPEARALSEDLGAWLRGDAPAGQRRLGPSLLAASLLLLSGAAGAFALSPPETSVDPTPEVQVASSPAQSASRGPTPEPEPALDSGLLEAASPDELVRTALRLEARGHLGNAGLCYAAAAAKRPRETFHHDWISGAALGDPSCVAACLREIQRSSKLKLRIVAAFERGVLAERPAALEALGSMLCTRDSGVPLDYARGLAYLARVETPQAASIRGRLGRLGCGGLSPSEATRLLERAAAGGDAAASLELALSVLARPLPEIDRELALRHLRAAARGGDARALTWLSQEQGARLPAADLIQRARAGDPMSCLRVGAALREGKMVPRHLLGAHDWIRRAAEHPKASGRAATDLARLHEDLLEDPAGALIWARRALAPEVLARSGAGVEFLAVDVAISSIMNHLKGDDPYLESSLKDLLQRGRELDSPRVAVALGKIHDLGPRQDLEAACAAYAWGAELGQSDCQLSLARCLRDGRGVPRDYAEAYRLAAAAAAQEELGAYGFLIFATYRGEGVAPDPAEAARMARRFQREFPGPESAYTLGRLLVASEEISEREEGLAWIRRSNIGSAKYTLETIARRGKGVRTPLAVGPKTD